MESLGHDRMTGHNKKNSPRRSTKVAPKIWNLNIIHTCILLGISVAAPPASATPSHVPTLPRVPCQDCRLSVPSKGCVQTPMSYAPCIPANTSSSDKKNQAQLQIVGWFKIDICKHIYIYTCINAGWPIYLYINYIYICHPSLGPKAIQAWLGPFSPATCRTQWRIEQLL